MSSAKGVVWLLTGGDQLDPLCVAARWGGVRDTGGGMFKRQQRGAGTRRCTSEGRGGAGGGGGGCTYSKLQGGEGVIDPTGVNLHVRDGGGVVMSEVKIVLHKFVLRVGM